MAVSSRVLRVFSSCVATGSDPVGASLRVTRLLEVLLPFNRTGERIRWCTSPGVSCPYSARRNLAFVPVPAATTTARNRPSSGFHTLSTDTHPTPCKAAGNFPHGNHHLPRSAPGVHHSPKGSDGSFDPARACRRTGASPRCSPHPRRTRYSRVLPSCASDRRLPAVLLRGAVERLLTRRFKASIAGESAFAQWRTARAYRPEVSGRPSHSRVRAVYSSPWVALPRSTSRYRLASHDFEELSRPYL